MDLFPPIDPHASGMLETGDGHAVYWEESGNPKGVPVLFVHGGPGAGTAPPYRRFFDPSFWRIILFDQRGCGRSIPSGQINANTTQHLIADMEKLRAHLGVERWLLFGGSWGSTLALAYGQAHARRVLGFVLRGVFLFRRFETDWFLRGMGKFFPESYRSFLKPLPPNEPDVLGAYYRLLTHADPGVHVPAARAWCTYEESCARLIPRADSAMGDAAACVAMARIECHFMVHDGFLAPDQLLAGMASIAHLPAIIVQGRYDVVCPPVSAADLAERWPGARLTMVADAGHSSMEPGIRTGLVAAVEDMKHLVIAR